MQQNNTGKTIIHKGLGNRIIRPGQFYPGREVGEDGLYLDEKQETVIPTIDPDFEKQGTGRDPGAFGHELAGRQSDPPAPVQWLSHEEYAAMEHADLKKWAKETAHLEFPGNISNAKLLELIEEKRPKAEGETTQNDQQ